MVIGLGPRATLLLLHALWLTGAVSTHSAAEQAEQSSPKGQAFCAN